MVTTVNINQALVTPTGVSTSQPLADAVGQGLLPYGSVTAFMGDSITARGFTIQGAATAFTAQAWYEIANAAAGQRLTLPPAGMLGISGETTAQMAARYSALTSMSPPPKLVVIEAGTNDASTPEGTLALAVTPSNFRWMIAQNRKIGARTIIMKVPPRNNPMAGTILTKWLAINADLDKLAASDVMIIDVEPLIGNMDANHSIQAGITTDNDTLHPNALGAFKMAPAFQTAIEKWVGSGDLLFPSVNDPRNLLTTGFMLGTTGTKNTATGEVATGWALAGQFAGGATITASKIARTDGYGETQRIAVSGTYTGSTAAVTLTGTADTSALVAGDIVELFAEVEFEANPVNIGLAYMRMALGANFRVANGGDLDASLPGGWKRVLKTPQFLFTGTVASMDVRFALAFVASAGTSPVSGAMRIGRVGARKGN